MGAQQLFFDDLSLIYTQVEGLLTGSMLKEHVAEADEIVRTKGAQRFLSDLRNVCALEDLASANIIGSDRTGLENRESITAILITKDREDLFNLARAYQICSGDHRKEMRIFYDLEEALLWLLPDKERAFEILTAIQKL